MSRLLIDQDWESTDSPFTMNATCSRSSTNAIDGTDLRCGDGTAVDGYATYSLATVDQVKSGSARGLRITGTFKFKCVTLPTGGNPDVMLLFCGGSEVFRLRYSASGANISFSGLVGGSEGISPTTLTVGTVYEIRWEYYESRTRHGRLFVDGTLIGTAKVSGSFSTPTAFDSMRLGLFGGGGKVVWQHVIGRFKLWTARDTTS